MESQIPISSVPKWMVKFFEGKEGKWCTFRAGNYEILSFLSDCDLTAA